MFNIIKKIFGLCIHNFEVIQRIKNVETWTDGTIEVDFVYVSRCKNCGKIRQDTI